MSSALARRVAFTLGALLVFRIGTYIPLPGIDTAVWARIFNAQAGGILSLANISSGGAVRNLAVFALGIGPYVTAAILIQLMSMGWGRLRALNDSDSGRRTLVAYTTYLTLALAATQAYGVAKGLERVPGVVAAPGLLFRLTAVATFAGGTMLLVWLSRLITARGIGNGLALILATGIVADLPATIAEAFIGVERGILPGGMIAVSLVLAAAIIAVIALVEGARLPIAIDFPKREIGGKSVASRSAPLMLRINSAGLMPTVIAGWLIGLTLTVLVVVGGVDIDTMRQFSHGRPLFMLVYGVLIVLFTLFYTAFIIDPDKSAETLKRYGGVIRGIAPGEATAGFLDTVLTRVTLVGALYLALLFLMPEIFIVYFGVPFYLGGASMLLVVCAILDVGAQVRQTAKLDVGGVHP